MAYYTDGRLRCLRPVFVLLTIVLPMACSGSSGHERFIPSTTKARECLDVALKAWQQGDPRRRIETISPAVEVCDGMRKPGQQLRQYEILSEVSGPGPRCFAARLYLENPQEEIRAVFVVVGQDPIWVFRQEDYEMVARWDHAMSQEKAPGSPRPKP